MKQERRISMQTEVLRIGLDKVRVDYDFRNDTDEDVTTGVVFPVPPYELGRNELSVKEQSFHDFQLLVNGTSTPYRTETRAKLKNRDVTNELKRYGIDAATFGHFDEQHSRSADIRKLSPDERRSLIRAGLIADEVDTDYAQWKVEKKYFWMQTFPAHATTHISHTYTPVVGFGQIPVKFLEAAKTNSSEAERKEADAGSLNEARSVCPTNELLRKVENAAAMRGGLGLLSYVDFILTTANTWRQPISEFTLLVNRPFHRNGEQVLVSICWPGKVVQVGPDLFEATTTNFVPKGELRVGFFHLGKK